MLRNILVPCADLLQDLTCPGSTGIPDFRLTFNETQETLLAWSCTEAD